MNARDLRNEAEKIRTRAHAAQSDAQITKVTADGYSQRGDDSAASVEQSRVEALERQAAELVQQAEVMEHEADEKLRQAHELSTQQEQIRKDADAQINELEKQKRNLTGHSSGLF